MWKTRVPRPAALVLGIGLLLAGSTVAPAALAVGLPPDDVPDLTVNLSSNADYKPGYAIADPRSAVTYQITVRNPTFPVWDAELHRYYNGGAPASNIMVKDYLPDGSQFVSVSADSGFSCSQANLVVTCSGGSLQMGGTAHITIGSITPPLMATYITSAVVDPNNSIAERNEGNNYSSLSLNVVPLN